MNGLKKKGKRSAEERRREREVEGMAETSPEVGRFFIFPAPDSSRRRWRYLRTRTLTSQMAQPKNIFFFAERPNLRITPSSAGSEYIVSRERSYCFGVV